VIPFALPFEKNKKLSVIYGENGTGKSTICDAFDFIGNGKVGSLENRGLGKTTKYWQSVGKKPTDVLVAKHPNPATCPLCESAEKVAGLAERVKQRLEQFSALQSG